MRPASTEDLILELEDQIDLIEFIDDLMVEYIPTEAANRFHKMELCGISVRFLIIERLKKIVSELKSLDNSQ